MTVIADSPVGPLTGGELAIAVNHIRSASGLRAEGRARCDRPGSLLQIADRAEVPFMRFRETEASMVVWQIDG